MGTIEPRLALEDGSCIYLKKDNSCEIYENRPDMCRVKGNFEENAKACNKIIKLFGLEDKYHMDIKGE